MEDDSLFAGMMEMVDRREALGRLQPKCPHCRHEQVQLVDWSVSPAMWRCRICRGPFTLDLPKDTK